MTDNIFIPITTKQMQSETVQTVDARALHAFLGVNTAFDKWISRRIADYNFVENQDFIFFAKNGEKTFWGRGRPAADYALSLDMAKEMCMVERNEKGRQARRYFIAAEKRLAEAKIELGSQNPQLGYALRLSGGLTKALEADLLKKLQAAAAAKRPTLARLVVAAKTGMTWEDLRAIEPRAPRLLKAIEQALALGLINKAPKGTPQAAQGQLALTGAR